MCFSAPASFIASAGLLVIGAITIYRSANTPQRIFAGIPLIFSVQQFSEGLLWLSLSCPDFAHFYSGAMYVFLAFAQVVWPSFVPLTVLLLEKAPGRKKILRVLLGIGLFTSAYLLYSLLRYPVSAHADGHHIRYELDFPFWNQWYSGVTYILASVLPPFISSIKRLRLFAVILLLSYLVSRIFYEDYLISVWCYFAAVLSICTLNIINYLRKVDKVKA